MPGPSTDRFFKPGSRSLRPILAHNSSFQLHFINSSLPRAFLGIVLSTTWVTLNPKVLASGEVDCTFWKEIFNV
jgi:hypothetical protein